MLCFTTKWEHALVLVFFVVNEYTVAFSPLPLIIKRRCKCTPKAKTTTSVQRFNSNDDSFKESYEIDVSDLNLTMDDLNAPLPPSLLQSLSTSGYQSTSRITTVHDNGCQWSEDANTISVTLTIPGLRGQPAAAIALEMTELTMTITAFGYAVWSCILNGRCVKESLEVVSIEDGEDRVPVIRLNVNKAESGERWGGFIGQIGEDSIL